VRISGRNVRALANGILGSLPKPRHATYGNFLDDRGDVLDQGIALYFSAPHSYTGEDVLELQGHGGPAVLQLLLQRCLDLGARLAQPGEFTRRAFLNNKLDLAQAESVADLIDANTAEAAKSAMRSLRGDFSAAIHGLLTDLIHLRMMVEAMLDFPEEEVDMMDLGRRDVLLSRIQLKLQITLDSAKQGSLLREGAHVVIAGQPNVGKSSLLNLLSGEELALVSDTTGTTPRCNPSGHSGSRCPVAHHGYGGAATISRRSRKHGHCTHPPDFVPRRSDTTVAGCEPGYDGRR